LPPQLGGVWYQSASRSYAFHLEYRSTTLQQPQFVCTLYCLVLFLQLGFFPFDIDRFLHCVQLLCSSQEQVMFRPSWTSSTKTKGQKESLRHQDEFLAHSNYRWRYISHEVTVGNVKQARLTRRRLGRPGTRRYPPYLSHLQVVPQDFPCPFLYLPEMIFDRPPCHQQSFGSGTHQERSGASSNS
jgi:hypothetical protein